MVTWELFWTTILSNGVVFGLLAGIGYLFKDTILTSLSNKLEYSSAKKLQEAQQEFEKEFGLIRQEFEESQLRQEKVLSSLFDVSSERAKAISKREIDAAEAIWAATVKIDSLLLTAKTADFFKFDAIDRANGGDKEALKQIGEIYSQGLTPEFQQEIQCNWARLFVNDTAWAFYSAYSMIVLSGAMKMKGLALGVPVAEMMDKAVLKEAILKALPHQSETFDKYPEISGTLFLDELRQALIGELRRSIYGERLSDTEVSRANAILGALPKGPLPTF